jgi:hypothetical protein
MIDDIIQEKVQRGDVDPSLAVDMGYSQPRATGQPMSDGGQTMSGRRYQQVQVPNDAEFWIQVAQLLVLLAILFKL